MSEDRNQYDDELWSRYFSDIAAGIDPNEHFEDSYIGFLCAGCNYFEEGNCKKYPTMQFDFFKRKKKCKYFSAWGVVE